MGQQGRKNLAGPCCCTKNNMKPAACASRLHDFLRKHEGFFTTGSRKWRQTACKPGSVVPLRARTAIPLEPASLRASRGQPGRKGGTALATTPFGASPSAPIRPCSRWGLPCRRRCRKRGGLLPHRFTLARQAEAGRAVCSLWHFPWGRPRRSLTGTVVPWSPDFPPARDRSRASGRPAV